MGRKPDEKIRISPECMKEALKVRKYTQARLAKELNRDKDNLNALINRKQEMEIGLLKTIAKTINIAVEYLTGELLVTDPIELFTLPHTTERDSRGFLIPTYEETLLRKEIHLDSLTDYFLTIGNSLLDFQTFLIKEGYSSETPTSLKKLDLSECDYLFDRLRIIQELPSILHEIEIMREESNHGKED